MYHNLWITNQLFQLVNKLKTHTYCIVTMRHIVHSYGQALIYIHHWHETGHSWVHEYWIYKIKCRRRICEGRRSQTITLPYHNIMLCSRVSIGCYALLGYFLLRISHKYRGVGMKFNSNYIAKAINWYDCKFISWKSTLKHFPIHTVESR